MRFGDERVLGAALALMLGVAAGCHFPHGFWVAVDLESQTPAVSAGSEELGWIPLHELNGDSPWPGRTFYLPRSGLSSPQFVLVEDEGHRWIFERSAKGYVLDESGAHGGTHPVVYVEGVRMRYQDDVSEFATHEHRDTLTLDGYLLRLAESDLD